MVRAERPHEQIAHASGTPRAAARRKETSFGSDVARLVSGTTVTQALAVLITPVITRLYSPDVYGTMSLFVSLTTTIGVVACLRYEQAIVLPETDEEAGNLLAVSLASAVLMAGLTGIVLWLGQTVLLRVLRAPELRPYLWLAPIAVLLTGLTQALSYWNTRTKHFGRISLARVLTAITTATTKLIGGFAGYATSATLIGASVLGPAVAAVGLAKRIYQDDRGVFVACVRPRRMIEGMRRYVKFPLVDAGGALLNTLSWQLPTFMLNYFFSAGVVGHYALALRVLQLPVSLIGGAIGQAFQPRAARARLAGDLDVVMKATLGQLAIFGCYPMLMLCIVAPEAFGLAFGEQWAQAGVYAQILGVAICAQFVISPVSSACMVLERQDIGLLTSALSVSLRFLSFGIGGIAGSIELTLALFALSSLVVYMTMLRKLFKITGIRIGFLLAPAKRIAIWALPSCAVLLAVKVLALPGLLLVALGVLGVGLYALFELRPLLRLLFAR